MDGECLKARDLILAHARSGSPGLLVYHWDSDGAASAALVVRRTGREVWNRVEVPKIGVYGAVALPPAEKQSLTLVLDYGISGGEYDKYAAYYEAKIVAIDHHRVEPPSRVPYCNPVARELGDETEYPACSLLVGRLLYEEPGPLEMGLMALGIAGDLAPYIDSGRPHPGLDKLKRLAAGAGLDVSTLRDAADLVDSSYRVLDVECLRQSVFVLAEHGVKGLFDLECAKRNAERARTIVEEAFSSLERVYDDGVLEIHRLVYDAYVTSAVGRRLASERSHKIIVLLHAIPSTSTLFVYIRSLERSLGWLRERLERRGLHVGGKDRVIVVEARPGEERALLDIIAEEAGRRSG